MKGRRPRPLDDGDSGEVRVSGRYLKAKPIGTWLKLLEANNATIRGMRMVMNCTGHEIRNAANSLLQGALVAFPTETVYGLGADACNENAVAKIYKVKGRPSNHPLIVHISSINLLNSWVGNIPKYAFRLAEAFWPGPLTLILPSAQPKRDYLTGGQKNIGIRVPSHPLALSLLKEFESKGGLGIAAPSANKFGSVSPTTAEAVEIEIGKDLSELDLILDGGKSSVGIESTIISCMQAVPNILRPGGITQEMVELVLGTQVSYLNSFNMNKVRTPGLMDSHYSPKARIFLEGQPTKGDGLIALASITTPEGVIRLASPRDNKEYASQLYSAFRSADQRNIESIYVIPPIGHDIAVGINDRLKRAAKNK